MNSFRVELFGGLRIALGSISSDRLDGRKAGALIAYIAYFPNRPHARSTLIEILWPGVDATSARSSLRQALVSLRREAEEMGGSTDELVRITHTHVQLAPGVSTDVCDFDKCLASSEVTNQEVERLSFLREAVNYYHGNLLPAFDEMWIIGERRRRSDAVIGTLREIAVRLESGGDSEAAIDYYLRAVVADPAREENHLAVIRLFRANEQYAAALRQYKEMERALKSQIDEEPSAEAELLLEHIRREASETGNGNGNHATPYKYKIATELNCSPGTPKTGNSSHYQRAIIIGVCLSVLLLADIILRIVTFRAALVARIDLVNSKSEQLSDAVAPSLPAPKTVASNSYLAKLQFLFSSTRSGVDDIYTVRGDGTGLKRLTKSSGTNDTPAWSNNGGRVLFESSRFGLSQLCVMNADGSSQKPIMRTAEVEACPAISPDGKLVAFYSQRDAKPQLYVIGIDGKGLKKLSHGEGADYRPAFSPDGECLLFSRNNGRANELCEMTLRDGKVRQLTHSDRGTLNIAGSYSPDGRQIAFTSSRQHDISVYVVNRDGKDLRRITPAHEEADHPTWSPDGKWLIYSGNCMGNTRIFAIHPDGTEWTLLISSTGQDRWPSVRPSGNF